MDSSEIPRFSVHFPRKFPDFPRNSLIFPDFLQYSPIFSDFFPNFAVFLHYNILSYGKKRVYELGEASNTSPNDGKYSHCYLYYSWNSVDIAAIAPFKCSAIHPIKAIKIETITLILAHLKLCFCNIRFSSSLDFF